MVYRTMLIKKKTHEFIVIIDRNILLIYDFKTLNDDRQHNKFENYIIGIVVANTPLTCNNENEKKKQILI